MNTRELIDRWMFRANRMQHAHYESQRGYLTKHYLIGAWAIVLGALAGATALASTSDAITKMLPDCVKPFVTIIVGLTSVAATVLSALQTFLKNEESSEKHRLAGARFAHLKQRIELYAVSDAQDAALQTYLKEIETEWKELRQDSPGIPRGTWKRIDKKHVDNTPKWSYES